LASVWYRAERLLRTAARAFPLDEPTRKPILSRSGFFFAEDGLA
jgi:hypothetical protein